MGAMDLHVMLDRTHQIDEVVDRVAQKVPHCPREVVEDRVRETWKAFEERAVCHGFVPVLTERRVREQLRNRL
jgi:hypothetical protein